MYKELRDKLIEYLREFGLNGEMAEITGIMLFIFGILLIAFIIDKVTRYLLVTIFTKLALKTKTEWDDLLVENRVFAAISHLIPVLFIFNTLPLILDHSPNWANYISRFGSVVIIIASIIILFRILNVIRAVLRNVELFRGKPLDSYFQLTKIIISIILGTLVISIIFDKSIMYFFGAFGAMTAVLLLVFKDTILGFIASIQLAANDMIRVGDWVSMEKYGADGDVIEINLTTVKVRNWDKTITTVPTYSFISDSFKNWRGMQETGSRRIARSIYIDQNSVKFASEELIDKFKKIHILKEYVTDKQAEIKKYNTERKINTDEVSNGRRITNLGTFRAYLVNYLHNHPKINQDLTILVRQLEPTVNGIPMQIYAFSNDIEWVKYESIQSDIFDHVLSVLSQFELSIFQNPSGKDFKRITVPEE